MSTEEHHNPSNWWHSRSILVFLGFAAVAAFFLWTEHGAHLLGATPYILFLLCPLMHLFHGGHGGHGTRDDEHKKDR
jgi:Protein of unknown function (DUF2933)